MPLERTSLFTIMYVQKDTNDRFVEGWTSRDVLTIRLMVVACVLDYVGYG